MSAPAPTLTRGDLETIEARPWCRDVIASRLLTGMPADLPHDRAWWYRLPPESFGGRSRYLPGYAVEAQPYAFAVVALRRFPWFVLGDGRCALARRASTRRDLAARGLATWPALLAGVAEIARDTAGTGDVATNPASDEPGFMKKRRG